MKHGNAPRLRALLVAAAGMGAAFGRPHTRSRQRAPHAEGRADLGGRGSQIGVTIRDAEEADAKTNKIAAPSGVVIEEVTEDSPGGQGRPEKGRHLSWNSTANGCAACASSPGSFRKRHLAGRLRRR